MAVVFQLVTDELVLSIPKGMAIGDGLCDPITMTDYGDFLYNTGLIDEVQKDWFSQKQDLIVKNINKRLWKKAFEVS